MYQRTILRESKMADVTSRVLQQHFVENITAFPRKVRADWVKKGGDVNWGRAVCSFKRKGDILDGSLR